MEIMKLEMMELKMYLSLIINKGYNMKYRSDKYGNQISILGYGCMRFTSKGTKLDFLKKN